MALKHVALVENLLAKSLLRWLILLRDLHWLSLPVPISTPRQLSERLLSTRYRLGLRLTR